MASRRRMPAICAAVLAVCGLAGIAASAGPADGADAIPAQVTFNGSGTYTIDQTYVGGGGECTTHDVVTLAWVSNFDTTIDNGVLKAATGELAAGVGPGNMGFTIGGTCTYKDIVPSCSSALGTTGATQPSMTVSGTDPQRVEAQSLQPDLTTSFCSPTDAAFMGSDLSVLQASLPDSTAAVVDIPQSQLSSGYSASVSSANSPGQIASSCLSTGQHGTGNTSCSASLSWSGTLAIKRSCPPGEEAGTVTFIEGTASAGGNSLGMGKTVCKGDKVKAGPHSRVEITLKDGSIVRIGPDSEAQITAADYSGGERHITVKLVLGKIWAKVSTALGAGSKFEVTTDRAAIGVRGRAGEASEKKGMIVLAPRKGGSSSMTVDVSNRRYPDLVHVVSGAASVSFGKKRVSVAAGFGAYFKHKARLTTSWPADDRALLPAIDLPPAISGLKATAPRDKAKVAFKLDRPASVLLEVMKGKRVLVRRRTAGRRGRNVVRLPKLHKGRYAFQFEASHKGLVSAALSSMRVG